MRAALTAIAVILLASMPATAQVSPFDMSTEKPAVPAPVPPPADAVPATPDSTVVPKADAAPVATPAPVEAASSARRYIVPFTELVLPGEYSRRSWSIFLTPEQAESNADLHVGYQNAVIVAPEASRLKVSVNGSDLVDIPIASSGNPSELSVAVPQRLLHAGMNDIAISAVQRHRTDCTIESTYELWTQIDTAKTFISFADPEAGRWKRVDDLRAIGVDETGSTTFNMIVPSMAQTGSTPRAVRLGEALGLLANMPNQAFAVSTGAPAAKPGGRASAGTANIVLGPAAELAGVLSAVPVSAEAGPSVTLVDDPRLGPSTLVVSGPSWQAVDMAIDDIAKPVDRPASSLRASLGTRPWRTPDVPMLLGAGRFKFSELGAGTLEFAGRRARMDFAVGVPSDFYAEAYGEATILLDAAYSDEVLPGSHIDVYVNDNIAATVPITATGGEILRHLPINVTMRHFRPGDNVIAIEAVLMTRADAVCAPGETAQTTQRFAVFDSSEFVMPDYARVARIPNLGSVGGTGFPYGRLDYATPLIVDRTQPQTVSAAVTLLARMSVVAGRLIPVDMQSAASAVGDRSALFVGAISQVPPAVLAQVGLADDSGSSWGETVASVRPDTEATFDRWREKLRGGGWRGQVTSFEDWMNRTFNVSTNSFRIFSGPAEKFKPSGSDSLVVAQEGSPTGAGTWTLVTAPTVDALREGVRSLTAQGVWRQLGGHITSVDVADNKVATVPAARFDFIETQPVSLFNYRLIAANWLSANALSYAVVLTTLSIVLGFATAVLLASLGRKK